MELPVWVKELERVCEREWVEREMYGPGEDLQERLWKEFGRLRTHVQDDLSYRLVVQSSFVCLLEECYIF